MVRDERKKQTTKETEKVCLVDVGRPTTQLSITDLVVTSMK